MADILFANTSRLTTASKMAYSASSLCVDKAIRGGPGVKRETGGGRMGSAGGIDIFTGISLGRERYYRYQYSRPWESPVTHHVLAKAGACEPRLGYGAISIYNTY